MNYLLEEVISKIKYINFTYNFNCGILDSIERNALTGYVSDDFRTKERTGKT